MRIAYLDTFSGISGDMTVGALLHLGLPIERLRDAIAVLGLEGVEVWADRIERSSIVANPLTAPGVKYSIVALECRKRR